MNKNIFTVFLVFLFLTMHVSSAATADVKVESVVHDPSIPAWTNSSSCAYSGLMYFNNRVTNQGPDTVNITLKENIPKGLELQMYQVRYTGVPWVVNDTSYNPNTGIWTLNNMTSGRYAYLYYIVRVTDILNVSKITSVCNMTFEDPDLTNNQVTIMLHSYRNYQDYFISNGIVNSTPNSVKYQIKNTTKWTRNIKASSVAIQKYTAYIQDMRNKKLYAINKFTGNNRWYITLDKVYDRAQFLTGKYLVLMSSTKAVLINLNTHKAVWGKNYSKADSYSLIKSKKNGKYYIMAAINGILKFFKINLF